MISQQILSLYRRPENGIYKRRFNGSVRFKELYELMADYHFALKAIEEEIVNLPAEALAKAGKGAVPISLTMFPKKDREPLDKAGYSGYSKLAFYAFIKAVKLYHDALTAAEEQFKNLTPIAE